MHMSSSVTLLRAVRVPALLLASPVSVRTHPPITHPPNRCPEQSIPIPSTRHPITGPCPPVNPTSTRRLTLVHQPLLHQHAQRMVSTPAATAPLTSCNTSYFVLRRHSPPMHPAPMHPAPVSMGCLTGLHTVLAPVSPLMDEQRQKLLAQPSVLEHAHKVMGNNQSRAGARAFAGSCLG